MIRWFKSRKSLIAALRSQDRKIAELWQKLAILAGELDRAEIALRFDRALSEQIAHDFGGIQVGLDVLPGVTRLPRRLFHEGTALEDHGFSRVSGSSPSASEPDSPDAA